MTREACAPLQRKGQNENYEKFWTLASSLSHFHPYFRDGVGFNVLKHLRAGLNSCVMTQVTIELLGLEKAFQSRLEHACLCWQYSSPPLGGCNFYPTTQTSTKCKVIALNFLCYALLSEVKPL